MKTQKVLSIFFGLISIFFIFIVLILSILQINYTNCYKYWSLFNSIAICLLTSSTIVFLQSLIAYFNEKKQAILIFYKDAFILESKIIDCAYSHYGFISPENGLQYSNEIIYLFYTNLKYSFCVICKSKKDSTIKAVQNLYELYYQEIKLYINLKEACQKAIEVKEQLQKNPNLPQSQIDCVNQKMASAEKQIIESFNSKERLAKNKGYFNTIEKYLFQ